jgi:hypothetical protein
MSDSTILDSTIEMLHRSQGGEFQFWSLVVTGRMAPSILEKYRQTAQELAHRGQERRVRDLTSLEEDGARRDFVTALEVGSCLADSRQGRITRCVADKDRKTVYELVHAGILDFLDAAGVVLPPGREAHIGRRLVDHLTGPAALDRFRRLLDWLAQLRRRHESQVASGEWVPARHALIGRLVSHAFARDDSGAYRYCLSFRLFLRYRLFRICKKQHWPCRASRGLRRSFMMIDREDIGTIFKHAVADVASPGVDPLEKSLEFLNCDLVPTAPGF